MNVNDESFGARPNASRRRALILYLLVPAAALLIGIVGATWLLTRWDGGARMIGLVREPEPVVQPQTARPPPAAPKAAEPNEAEPAEREPAPERILVDPAITQRVIALEQHIAQIDTQSRAAVGNADRAEGLLVAFAARRALDRGVALGFLEALLRQRFGETQPQAVGTIITAARQPVTLQELQDELQEVGPQLIGAGPQQSWWAAMRAELGNLITVRREGTPSPEPAERLHRATRRLEAGQVDVALAEVMRLPAREVARDWIVKARRYVAARRALDTIETAALLEPRTRPAAAQPAEPEPAAPAQP